MNHEKTKRHSSREIRRELRSIYSGSDGRIPDMSKLVKRRRSTITRFLIRVALFFGVVSIVAWSGFFIFSKGFIQNGESLTFSVEGPDEIKSGEEHTFTFRYENTSAVPIASLTMKLNAPETFHVFSTVPENNNNEWKIGSLTQGSDGAISITGVFLSEVPSSERLQALFTYKPANFNSDFQGIVVKKIEVIDSVLAMSVTGPQKALAGDVSEYVINLQNTGVESVYNLRVTPELPPDFVLNDSQPTLAEGETSWMIPILQPGELSAITIRGAFTSTASGEEKMNIVAGFLVDDVFLPQIKEEITTDVLGGSVAFSVIVNGSNENQTIELGDTLRASIDFANRSGESVEGLTFEMNLKSEAGTLPINWEGAEINGGEKYGNAIRWGSDIEALKKLEPEAEGVIDLSIPIVSSLGSNMSDSFTVSVTLTIKKVGSVKSTRAIDATPIAIALNTDVTSSAHARYFSQDGEAIGSGPLPPRVRETTRYRIYWNVHNSVHALENATMSTTLPKDVAWVDSSDANIGSLTYNPTTRQVVWTISKLPIDVQSAGAWFGLAISPQEVDVGRFMKLTNTTSFEGKDSKTGKTLSQSIVEITTELPDDDFATGKGIVSE